MAHLDVVPVDESRAVAAPAVRRRDPRRRGLGARHPRRQGLPGRDLRGRRAAARADGFTPAQDVWLSFGSDEEVFGTAASEAVAELTRRGVEPWFVVDEGGAIAGRRVPRHQAAGRRDRRDREGRHQRGAPGRRPRRPRVDAGEVRADRAAGPRDPARRPLPDAGAASPTPTVELFRRLAPHAPLPAAPADGQRRPAAPGSHQGARRGRPRVGRDDPHDVRHHHAVGLPRPQRDRVDGPGRHQHPRHGRRHRGRRDRPPAQGDRRRAGAHRRGRGVRGEPGLARSTTTPSASSSRRSPSCSPTPSRRRT